MDLQTNYPPEIFATLGTSECFLTIVISFMDLQTQWSMDLFHIWNSWMVSHLYKFFNRFSNLLITGNCLNILNNGIVFYHFESHYESSTSLTNSNCCHIWNNLMVWTHHCELIYGSSNSMTNWAFLSQMEKLNSLFTFVNCFMDFQTNGPLDCLSHSKQLNGVWDH